MGFCATLDRPKNGKKGGGLTLIELAPGVTLDEIKAKTEADFDAADDCDDTGRNIPSYNAQLRPVGDSRVRP